MNPYSLIQIILYAMAASLAVVAIFNKSDTINKYDKLYLIGIILTLALSILLETLKAKDEKDKSLSKENEYKEYITYLNSIIQKSDSTLKTADSTLKAQRQIQNNTDSIINLNSDLLLRNQRIINLQGENIKNITGGDSYCELIMMHFNDNSCQLALINKGKYTLYDLNFRIVDLDDLKRFDNKKEVTLQDVIQTQKTYDVGNLSINSSLTLGSYSFQSNLTEKRFNIFFNARNGFFTQEIIIRKKQSKWIGATRITNDNKVLFEKINSGFLNTNEKKFYWK